MSDIFDELEYSSGSDDSTGDIFDEIAPEEKSALSPVTDLLKGVYTGFRRRIPEQIGQAMEFTGVAPESGKALKEWAREGEEPGEKGMFTQAGEMMPASSAIPMGLNVAGELLTKVPHPYARLAGLGVKGLSYVAAPLLFGLSQARSTEEAGEDQIKNLKTRMAETDDLTEKGALADELSRVEENMKWAPYVTGGTEALGETFGNYALLKLLGPLAGKAAAGTLKGVFKPTLGRFTKELATRTLPTEILTEMGQNYAEATAEKKTGIRPTANPWEEAVSAIGPTAIMTLLTGSGGRMLQTHVSNNYLKDLSNPEMDTQRRQVIADSIGHMIETDYENPELAAQWNRYAGNRISAGEAIDPNMALTPETLNPSMENIFKDAEDNTDNIDDMGKKLVDDLAATDPIALKQSSVAFKEEFTAKETGPKKYDVMQSLYKSLAENDDRTQGITPMILDEYVSRGGVIPKNRYDLARKYPEATFEANHPKRPDEAREARWQIVELQQKARESGLPYDEAQAEKAIVDYMERYPKELKRESRFDPALIGQITDRETFNTWWENPEALRRTKKPALQGKTVTPEHYENEKASPEAIQERVNITAEYEKARGMEESPEKYKAVNKVEKKLFEWGLKNPDALKEEERRDVLARTTYLAQAGKGVTPVKEEKEAKRIPPKSLRTIIIEKGGLSRKGFDRNMQDVSGGNVMFREAGEGLDKRYRTLVEEGFIPAKPADFEGSNDDYLWDLIVKDAQGIAVTLEQLDKQIDDDIMNLEDIYVEAFGKEIERADLRRVQEEAAALVEKEEDSRSPEEITRAGQNLVEEYPDVFVTEEDEESTEKTPSTIAPVAVSPPPATKSPREPVKTQGAAKQPPIQRPKSAKPAEREKPATDLGSKSISELVADAFSIINDHIGERGSISGEKLEINDTLYQKLKPILAEIARRAKEKALDVKSYLFGAVDSQPEGSAKKIYEAAAEHYAREGEKEPEKKKQEPPKEKVEQKPWSKEDPYMTAVGILSGGYADRAVNAGYRFVKGDLKKDSGLYWDMVGLLSGSYADRLLNSGITVEKTNKQEGVQSKKKEKADLLKRASDVYKAHLEKDETKGIVKRAQWEEQTKELIEDPERYHEVMEEENDKGLRIGDRVVTHNDRFGDTFGTVVGVGDYGRGVIEVNVMTDGSYGGFSDLADVDKLGTEEPAKKGSTPSTTIADWVRQKLESKKSFTKNDLYNQAAAAFGGTQAEGKFSPKDAFDAMELGINKYILSKPGIDPATRVKDIGGILPYIRKRIMDNIPSQMGYRTEEMNEFQQFSTPPDLAFVMNWVANIQEGTHKEHRAAKSMRGEPIIEQDTVLEPSAGIGGLAAFAKNAGAKVIVNELSPRRAELLKEMGFDQVFSENAEQLNNILPETVKPTVVIMNPPFSASAGRIKGERDPKNLIKHINQALGRLQKDGRLVVLTGAGLFGESKKFNDWLGNIGKTYDVLADITISGKGYAKYGTTFDNRLIIIDKKKTDAKIIKSSVEDVQDAIPLLEGVRNARTLTERSPGESESQGTPGRTESGDVAGSPLFASTGGVGNRPQQGIGVSGTQRGPESGPGQAGKPVTAPTTELAPHREGIEGTNRPAASEGTQGSERGGSRTEDSRSDHGQNNLLVEKAEEQYEDSDLSQTDVYETYRPALIVKGAKEHPAKLVESAAMAAVKAPETSYTPKIARHIIDQGKLSDVQLEAVIRAGQAHGETLPDGNRKGFFIGDGTGVGKGREIAGIILDNWNQGRKKAVWVSKNTALIEDARRDFRDLGIDPSKIIDASKVKLTADIPYHEGVVFIGYDTLRSEKGQNSRLKQIVKWMGEKNDGVVAFDEAHLMGNAIPTKGKRGIKKASQRALKGIELQKAIPQARIVYASATGATELSNLSYCERLGLWGPETPFPANSDFINSISKGGMASMELVAQAMKSAGSYISRNLSLDGVETEPLIHELTPDQRDMYDELARAWQIVLNNIHNAFETTGVVGHDGHTQNSQAKKNVMGQFWGSHLRFFSQILTSLQTPSLIQSIEKDMEEGRASVVQLVNTNEAQTDRAIANLEEDQSLEELDITPREQLIDFLMKSFPVQQFEEYQDDKGNIKSRPVLDSHGNPVLNKEAVAMRTALIQRLGAIRIPDGALDMILNHFGTSKVGEVTGRSRRVVYKNDEAGNKKRVIENWSKAKGLADTNAFMDDRKRILCFSDAGGTGKSYHADLNEKNQRKRVHYILQAGWRADAAVQGVGRTHRSNQKQPPTVRPVSTDLKGQKRFTSSIARRLEQLGSLTKGQRDTTSQGIFSARDNLESPYARDAWRKLVVDIALGKETVTLKEFEQETGLKLTDADGKLLEQLPEITQFLNRILSMTIDRQNDVFDMFEKRLDAIIEREAAAGTLDVGMETVKAKEVRKVKEQIVFKDKSGAETKYVQVDVVNEADNMPFDRSGQYAKEGYFVNNKSGNVWAAGALVNKTETNTGKVYKGNSLYGPNGQSHGIQNDHLLDPEKYRKVSKEEAETLWNEELKGLPKEKKATMHFISGSILPIWDRLPDDHVRIMRMKLNTGEKLLGRLIPPKSLTQVLGALQVSREKPKMSPSEVYDAVMSGSTVHLANKWTISRKRASGEYRIEVDGDTVYRFLDQLKQYGAYVEEIRYRTRVFVPTGQDGKAVVSTILDKISPMVDVEGVDIPVVADIQFTYGKTGQILRENGETREADNRTRKGAIRYPEVVSKKTGTLKVHSTEVTSDEDVAQIAHNLVKDPQEQLIAILTDENDKIVAVHRYSRGIANASLYSPNIVGHALSSEGVKNIWLAHNHPSQAADLSREDNMIFSRLLDVAEGSGVIVRNMIAVTGTKYGTATRVFTYKAKGKTITVPVVERRFFKAPSTQGREEITDQEILVNVAKQVVPEGGIILTDTRNRVAGTVTVSNYGNLRGEDQARLLKESNRRNALEAFIYEPNRVISMPEAQNIINFTTQAGCPVQDIVDKNGSMKYSGMLPKAGTVFYSKGTTYRQLGPYSEEYYHADKLRKIMDPFLSKFPESVRNQIEIIQGNRDFPEDFIERAGTSFDIDRDEIYGAYDPATGKIYIVADAIHESQQAEKTVVEELVGHKGLSAILTRHEHNLIKYSVFHRSKNTPEMARLIKDYGLDVKDLTDMAAAGEEYMVHHMPTVYETPTLWQRIVAVIRGALRRYGLVKEYSDADIRMLMERAAQAVITEQKGTKNDLLINKPISYSKETDINKSFADRLDKYLRGEMGKQVAVVVSDTPIILQRLGAKALPVTMSDGTIEKILHRKHGIPLDTLKQLPGQLHNPIAVFDSKTEPDSYVVMTELTDQKGNTIIAAVHLSKEYGRHEVNDIASVYGKDRDKWFKEEIDKGRLRYINNKKASNWFMTRGLQLPTVRGTNQGSKKSILTENDFVKNNKDKPLYGKEASGKEAVVFIGMQPTGSSKPPLRLVNNSIGSTVTYNPEKHIITNREQYEAAVSEEPKGKPLFSKDSGDPSIYDAPADFKTKFNDSASAYMYSIGEKAKSPLWREIFGSPEWVNHPVIKKLVKIFTDIRSELFHDYFNDLIEANKEENIVDELHRLKNKGLTMAQRIMGETSNEYQMLEKIIDDADTEQIEPDEMEIILKERNTPADVVHAWRRLRKSWDKALKIMTAELQDVLKKQKELGGIPGSENIYELLEKALAEMGRWYGTYAPRIRPMGDYVLQATIGEDQKKRHFRTHGSAREMHELAAQMKRKGWDTTVQKLNRLPESTYQNVRTVETANLIENALRGLKEQPFMASQLSDEIVQLVADTIRARGFRQTMIHRGEKLVTGYITDPMERYVKYVSSLSGGLSKAQVARQAMATFQDIDPASEGRLHDTALNYIQENLRNLESMDRLFGLAKSVATFKFLGFNLRSLGVNLTAIATTAPAAIHQYALGGKVGFGQIGAALASASKGYTRFMVTGKVDNKEEQAFLDLIRKQGYDDPQYTREATSKLQKVHGQAWNKLMGASMWMFGKSEQWNRGTTMLAAYRLAKQQGMNEEEAIERAREASNRAHGIYGKGTLPSWATGSNFGAKLGQAMYTYRKFSHNYVQMLIDLIKKENMAGTGKRNIKAFAWALMSPVVLAGTAVFPFRSEIMTLIGGILRTLGVMDDPEKWWWEQVRKYLGETGETVGRHGLTGLAGVDISGSLSVGIGIPKDLWDLTGPVGGVWDDLMKAKNFMVTGQPLRAIEKALPTGITNPLRAFRESTSGVRTEKGATVFDEEGKPMKLSPTETAARAVGFRGVRQAVKSEQTQEIKGVELRFEERRKRIYEEARAYFADPDRKTTQWSSVWSKVKKYNEDVVSSKMQGIVSFITPATLHQQAKKVAVPTKKERGRITLTQ